MLSFSSITFPSKISLPEVGFNNPNIKFAAVVLPLPVLPTKAIFEPILIFKSIFFKATFDELG